MDNTDEQAGQDDSKDCTDTGVLAVAGEWIVDSVSGLPAPIRKNAWKAFGQLCTAALQYPVAFLEGAAKEKVAESNARIKLIEKSAELVSDNLSLSPDFGALAAKKYASKILREQINLEKVAKIAIAELKDTPELSVSTDDVISDDWLNGFEREAADKSSEEMQLLFGRILAGEIKRPKTFSLHTLRTIGQIDSEVAELFVKFCSMSLTISVGDDIVDVRILAIDKTAGANGLREHGLNYINLTLLQEHGLVSSALDSHAGYSTCVIEGDLPPPIPLRFIGKTWGLRVLDLGDLTDLSEVRGVSLSKVGRELSKIVDIVPDEAYSRKLFGKFRSIGFEMIEVAG